MRRRAPWPRATRRRGVLAGRLLAAPAQPSASCAGSSRRSFLDRRRVARRGQRSALAERRQLPRQHQTPPHRASLQETGGTSRT
eukprot:4805792-Pyramimonas_sp.AAC.1